MELLVEAVLPLVVGVAAVGVAGTEGSVTRDVKIREFSATLR